MKPTILLFRQMFTSSPRSLSYALLVFAAGLAMLASRTYLLNKYLVGRGEEKLELFNHHVEQGILDKLQSQAQLLSNATALFEVTDTVTREKWHRFIKGSSMIGFPSGIQGIGYAAIIPADKLLNHILQVRKEGFPDYGVKPQGASEFYAPVVYIEPFSGRNLRAFGYDVYSDSTRREAMEKSRDTGLPTLTGKLVLRQEMETDKQNGSIMFLPVYARNKPVNTTAERRLAIIGWVYSAIRMNDLMQSILKEQETDSSSQPAIQLHQSGIISEKTLLFTTGPENHTGRLKLESIRNAKVLNFHGTNWTISMSLDISDSHYYANVIYTALFWGLVLSLTLFFLTLSLLNTRQHARQIANILTQKLTSSEFMLRLAMMGANEVGWELDPQSGRMNISPSLRLLLQLPEEPDESDESFFHRCFHPDDLQKYQSALQKFIDGELSHFENEFRLVPSEGVIIYLQSQAMKHFAGENGDIMLYGTFEDVTYRKNSEQQILELSAIVEYCPLVIAITDLKGNFEYVNPAFSALTGYSSDEVLGRNMSLLQSGKTLPSVYKDLWATITKGKSWRGEFVNRTKDGREYIESTIITPIYKDREIYRYMTITDNISEKRKLENEIQENMQRLNLVIKGSNDAPWDWNLVTQEFYFSPQWYRMLGIRWEGLMPGTDSWSEFVHPDDKDRSQSMFKNTVEGQGDSYEMEYRLRHRDGHYIPILSRGFVTRGQDGVATRVSGTDMNLTQQKETEYKLNKQNLQLKELVATRDKFFKIIAHDLRNPFNAILGLTDTIQMFQNDMEKEKILKFVKTIRSTGLNTYKLLENLLVWARMQTGDIAFQPADFELEPLFIDVITLSESLMKEKNISINYTIPENLKIHADQRMVETILRNLVMNAAKYTFRDGKVTLNAVLQGGKAEISVCDNGMGMSKEVVSQLFDITVRNSREGTEKEQGTGLGLLLCREFLARHGETILVKSNEGIGSEFTFSLPLA